MARAKALQDKQLKLYRCDRMNAIISAMQCEINRNGAYDRHRQSKTKPCLSCEGCPGLGSMVQINMEDVVEPKTSKPQKSGKPVQSVPPPDPWECPHCHCVLSTAEVDGSHCPVCGKPLPTGQCEQAGEALDIPSPFGLVANGEGAQVPLVVDPLILRAIDEGLADLRASWLIDLSGLPPGLAVCTTYHKLEQLQTLRG